jgi:hypothetical protein
MGGKFTTQHATKVAAGGFPVANSCHYAIELTLHLFWNIITRNVNFAVNLMIKDT